MAVEDVQPLRKTRYHGYRVGMKTPRERLAIADEIVRRVDTVALLKVEEVREIRAKALTGAWDDIFDEEEAPR